MTTAGLFCVGGEREAANCRFPALHPLSTKRREHRIRVIAPRSLDGEAATRSIFAAERQVSAALRLQWQLLANDRSGR